MDIMINKNMQGNIAVECSPVLQTRYTYTMQCQCNKKKLIQQAEKIPPFINKWKSLRKCEQGLLRKLRSVMLLCDVY